MTTNMKHNDKVNNSAVGLDVGTSRICLAQRVGEDYQYETQLNAFVTIPYSKMTETVLKKEKVPHTVNGAEIVVHGNESDRFADLLNVETRRTMDKGVLNPAESDSLSMLRKIVESMVDPVKDKQKLCFTVPAAPLGAEENLTYHEATLKQILNELGYEVKSINEGLAVVYAEMESSNYTGIGISCGGGLVQRVRVLFVGPGVELFDSQSRRLHRFERRHDYRRARQSRPHGQGRFVPLQRLLRRQAAASAGRVLRRNDPVAGAGHEAGFRQRAQLAAVEPAIAHRAERRNGDAHRLPRSF